MKNNAVILSSTMSVLSNHFKHSKYSWLYQDTLHPNRIQMMLFFFSSCQQFARFGAVVLLLTHAKRSTICYILPILVLCMCFPHGRVRWLHTRRTTIKIRRAYPCQLHGGRNDFTKRSYRQPESKTRSFHVSICPHQEFGTLIFWTQLVLCS